jgi:hypothetical protein
MQAFDCVWFLDDETWSIFIFNPVSSFWNKVAHWPPDMKITDRYNITETLMKLVLNIDSPSATSVLWHFSTWKFKYRNQLIAEGNSVFSITKTSKLMTAERKYGVNSNAEIQLPWWLKISSDIVAVSFIHGGNQIVQRLQQSLTNFITQVCIEYTFLLVGIKLTRHYF